MPTHTKYSVIIADDDPDEIDLLISSFHKHESFLVISTVENGQHLVDYFTQNNTNADIIITDMFMPIMNGVDAILKLQELKTLNNTLVTIFSTTINKSTEEKLAKLPKVAFYNKPATYKEYLELPEKLAQLLRNQNS